jgi:hypothetical protein
VAREGIEPPTRGFSVFEECSTEVGPSPSGVAEKRLSHFASLLHHADSGLVLLSRHTLGTQSGEVPPSHSNPRLTAACFARLVASLRPSRTRVLLVLAAAGWAEAGESPKWLKAATGQTFCSITPTPLFLAPTVLVVDDEATPARSCADGARHRLPSPVSTRRPEGPPLHQAAPRRDPAPTQEQGYVCLTAASGTEALEVVRLPGPSSLTFRRVS